MESATLEVARSTDSLAQSVRSSRTKAGLSQRDLAIKSGLTERTISGIEQGRASPTFRTLRLLAKALGIEPRRLLDAA